LHLAIPIITFLKNEAMQKNHLLLTVVATIVGMLSCNTDNHLKEVKEKPAAAGLDKQWAKSFIDSINAKFSEQFKAGDSAALASHYWPDAEILLSNSEAFKGPEILGAWGAMTKMGIPYFTFTTTDISGDSEFIIETGKYEMKDAKQTLADRGKYVVVWQNRNGEWKLYRDIGNTSMPAAK
jgi:ketosteroid isomerase-like protein